MAITGVLQADFSQFYTEVQKAEVSLRNMEGGAVKAEAAISNVGTRAAPPMNSLRESVRQFDQALSASGVNITKYTNGLADIAEASGKTISQLGLLASAGLLVSAWTAGWRIGEKIGEMTGWTKAIQDNTAALMGWGDVVSQAAGAKADALALASKNAGREITNLAEAVKINAAHMRDQADAYAVSAERLAAAQKEVRGLSQATMDAIAIAQRNGATTEQITRHFNISADALRALAERQKLAGQAADAHTAALEKQRAAVARLDADYAKLMSDVRNAEGLAKMEADAQKMLDVSNNAAASWIKQQVERKRATDEGIAAEKAYLAEQESLLVKIPEITAAHVAAGEAATVATTATAQGFMAVGQQVQITADAIKEWITLMKYAAQANAINRRNSLYQTTSQAEALAALGGPTVSGASGMVGARGGGGASSETINVVVDGRVLTSIVNDRTAKSLAQAGAV